MISIETLKMSKILLCENRTNKVQKVLKNKTTFKSVATYYEIAAIYGLHSLSKDLLCYIERFFTAAAETKNFLELSCKDILKFFSAPHF